jgi:precorrin-4/cobalt-precorrin-4 C11-methyltransferase
MSSTDLVPLPAVASPPIAQGYDRAGRVSRPLSISLTIHTLDELARNLLPFYGEDCPVAVVYDDHGATNEIAQGTLANIGRWAEAITTGRPVRVLVG